MKRTSRVQFEALRPGKPHRPSFSSDQKFNRIIGPEKNFESLPVARSLPEGLSINCKEVQRPSGMHAFGRAKKPYVWRSGRAATVGRFFYGKGVNKLKCAIAKYGRWVRGMKHNCYMREGKATPLFNALNFISRDSVMVSSGIMKMLGMISEKNPFVGHHSSHGHDHHSHHHDHHHRHHHHHLDMMSVFFRSFLRIPGLDPYAVCSSHGHHGKGNDGSHNSHHHDHQHRHHHDHHHGNHHHHLDMMSVFFRSFLRIPGLDPYAVCMSKHHARDHKSNSYMAGGHASHGHHRHGISRHLEKTIHNDPGHSIQASHKSAGIGLASFMRYGASVNAGDQKFKGKHSNGRDNGEAPGHKAGFAKPGSGSKPGAAKHTPFSRINQSGSGWNSPKPSRSGISPKGSSSRCNSFARHKESFARHGESSEAGGTMVGKNTDTQNTGAPPVVSVHDMDTIYYVMASARKRLLQLKVATASADPHPPK